MPLAQMMRRTGVDMMKCTPSYMQTMDFLSAARRPRPAGRSQRRGAFPGEPLFASCCGFEGIIFEANGLTETTVTVTID